MPIRIIDVLEQSGYMFAFETEDPASASYDGEIGGFLYLIEFSDLMIDAYRLNCNQPEFSLCPLQRNQFCQAVFPGCDSLEAGDYCTLENMVLSPQVRYICGRFSGNPEFIQSLIENGGQIESFNVSTLKPILVS